MHVHEQRRAVTITSLTAVWVNVNYSCAVWATGVRHGRGHDRETDKKTETEIQAQKQTTKEAELTQSSSGKSDCKMPIRGLTTRQPQIASHRGGDGFPDSCWRVTKLFRGESNSSCPQGRKPDRARGGQGWHRGNGGYCARPTRFLLEIFVFGSVHLFSPLSSPFFSCFRFLFLSLSK